MTTPQIERGRYHQLGSSMSVPCNPNLLKEMFDIGTLRAMETAIGKDELVRLSQDRNHSPANEGKNLEIVRNGIHAATGTEAPWIIGYASKFAAGLRAALADEGPPPDLSKETL